MCQEVSYLFSFANFQYIATVVAFSFGKPFKKPMYTNLIFFPLVLITTVLSLLILLGPGNDVRNIISLYDIENKWRYLKKIIFY